jgi:hypothetical protein
MGMRRLKGLILLAAVMAFTYACSGSEPELSPPPERNGGPLLTIGGTELGYAEVNLLIHSAVDDYMIDYSIDWDGSIGGLSTRRFFLRTALDNAVATYAIQLKADELNYVLTDEETDEIDFYIALGIDEVGDNEEFYRFFRYTVPFLSEKMQDSLYGEGGKYEPDDRELRQYFESSHITACYIFLSATDAYGEPLSGEDLDTQRSVAAALRQQAAGGADFFEMIRVYDQSLHMMIYPEGMPVRLGTFGAAFDEALSALAVGEISDVVVTDAGFFIILRLPEDMGWFDENRESILHFYGFEMFSKMVEEWGKELDVVVSEAFWSLDPLEMVAVG